MHLQGFDRHRRCKGTCRDLGTSGQSFTVAATRMHIGLVAFGREGPHRLDMDFKVSRGGWWAYEVPGRRIKLECGRRPHVLRAARSGAEFYCYFRRARRRRGISVPSKSRCVASWTRFRAAVGRAGCGCSGDAGVNIRWACRSTTAAELVELWTTQELPRISLVASSTSAVHTAGKNTLSPLSTTSRHGTGISILHHPSLTTLAASHQIYPAKPSLTAG